MPPGQSVPATAHWKRSWVFSELQTWTVKYLPVFKTVLFFYFFYLFMSKKWIFLVQLIRWGKRPKNPVCCRWPRVQAEVCIPPPLPAPGSPRSSPGLTTRSQSRSWLRAPGEHQCWERLGRRLAANAWQLWRALSKAVKLGGEVGHVSISFIQIVMSA